MARSEGESGELLKGAHLDPSKLTEGAPKAAVISTLWLPKFPRIQPSRRGYSSVSNPLSSGSMAIQSQVLSSEVKRMKGGRGEEKDLIPRKCSTNLPARCRKETLACPLVSFPPASVSVAAPRPECFHLTSIIRMCQSTTLQAGRPGQPLVRNLVASFHLSRFPRRGQGKSGRGGRRSRTPTWRGGGERGRGGAGTKRQNAKCKNAKKGCLKRPYK